jgi:hypothetical protein
MIRSIILLGASIPACTLRPSSALGSVLGCSDFCTQRRSLSLSTACRIPVASVGASRKALSSRGYPSRIMCSNAISPFSVAEAEPVSFRDFRLARIGQRRSVFSSLPPLWRELVCRSCSQFLRPYNSPKKSPAFHDGLRLSWARSYPTRKLIFMNCTVASKFNG